jgi:hypothetical protein
MLEKLIKQGFYWGNVAGVEGFEPPTVGFGDRCSTNWNYTPLNNVDYTRNEGIYKEKKNTDG